MKKKIKFAVVGCGHIGKRHAEMIRRNQDAELIAMCDIKPRDQLQLEAFKEPFYNQLEKMIKAHPEIDVVNICSPNGFHAEQSIVALNQGKHVVCEKPMGLSTANCQKVIATSEKKNRLVFCVMQNRYSPPSAWIKEVVDKKLLGKIYLVQMNCFWNRDDRYYSKSDWKGSKKLDGGTLFTQFSHFIDIMYWLFGDIKDIEAVFSDFTHAKSTEFEDSGVVNFNFVKEGMGSISYSTAVWNTNLESSITIIGEKGSIKLGGQYMNNVEYCNIDGYEMPELPEPSPANDYGTYKGSAANHHFVIENVIDTLQGKTEATTNAWEGLKVVDIIERIYALKNGKHVQ